MADNTPITPGTGATIATDDIGGVQYQRVKVTLGADGVSDGDVSADNPMPVTGAVDASGSVVAVSNLPSSQAVTGTFWQATQPVSGPVTDTQLRASPVPVSGTFYQATQPVSAAALPLPNGAATEATAATLATQSTLAAVKAKTDNLDVAISTLATQATLALIKAKTDNLDAALSTVATQATLSTLNGKIPSSPATDRATAAAPFSSRLSDGSAFYDAAKTGQLPSSLGQKTMANSLGVCLASDQASIPVAATCSGTVTANIGTTNGLALDATLTGGTQKAITRGGAKGATTAADLTGTAQGADHQALDVQIYHGGTAKDPTAIRALSAADVVTVTPPTLTKGTQGSTGFSVQDLKDSGRVLKTYTVSALTTVTTEALISLTPYADLTAGGGATTFAVTSGKRLRIQQIIVTVRCTSTVNVGGIVRLRLLAGTVLVTSPVHASIGCMGSTLATAVAGNAQTFAIDFPDGLELSGSQQFGLTQLFSATSATIDVHIIGYEY